MKSVVSVISFTHIYNNTLTSLSFHNIISLTLKIIPEIFRNFEDKFSH